MSDAAARLADVLRPANHLVGDLIAAGGNYVRRHGTWLYAATGEPVPGACDITLAQRYAAAPRTTRDDREYVFLDEAWLSGPQARPELHWCLPLALHIRGEHPALSVAVPSAELAARGQVVIGLSAPELYAPDLLTASAVARLLGVTRGTVNAYHSRGQMPAPAVTLSQRLPLWPRPIIDHWMAGLIRRHRRSSTGHDHEVRGVRECEGAPGHQGER